MIQRPHSFNYMHSGHAQSSMAVSALESYKTALNSLPREAPDTNWFVSDVERTNLLFAIDYVMGCLRARTSADPQFSINALHIESMAAAIAARPTDPTWT